LGVALAKINDREGAIVALKKAVELDPKNGQIHLNLAVAYRRQKKIDDAIKEYETAVSLDPGLAGGYYDLGLLYSQDRRYDDALTAFKKYLASSEKLDPESRRDAEERIKSLESAPKRK
jgi:superkiller protein 3